ncbi:DnaA regulatory inactivator Hda [Candidimonas nitroreducens]|uniref:DnaA regulatory inactivator Hda n=1 Tax=Candidimonas nitroreducens TaxID=683354 RepID=A0A225MKF9_9BURK|nr:DnaA regulatory inactivator Hda [Candidimonas nitroreducens]OWT60410.1 DnaA regulatory inactivator Hda [Candidimonas nitroreducens]
MSRQLILDLLPPPRPTLENFIAAGNGAALQALRELQPGRAVYLWGPPGAGRTHLLRALGEAPDCLYIGATDDPAPLNELATGDAAPPRLVAVDDVGSLGPAGQAAVFALYNRWRAAAHTPQAYAMLVAGERAPMAMPLREDLRTRLGWDLSFRLELLSDDERAAALASRAAERGLQLSAEVLNWVLTHYARDMGKLTALLDALDRYSMEKQRAITLPLLRELLAGTAGTVSTHPDTPL